jgi:tetratricopeptide (TPR) repeat protein
METVLAILLSIPFLVLRYYFHDHDTPADKDRRRFAEGVGLVQARQYDEALAYFLLMARQFPKSALLHQLKGRCNLGLGNFYSALYDFTVSLTLDNTLPETYLFKGQAHYQLTEHQAAFQEFDKAVWHTRSLNADALRWRALSRLHLGQTEQARQDLEKALQLGDENAAFHLNTLFTPDGTRLRDFRRKDS